MAILPILPLETTVQINNEIELRNSIELVRLILASRKNAGEKILPLLEKNFTLLIPLAHALKDGSQKRSGLVGRATFLLKIKTEKVLHNSLSKAKKKELLSENALTLLKTEDLLKTKGKISDSLLNALFNLQEEDKEILRKQILPISVFDLVDAGSNSKNKTKALLLFALEGNCAAIKSLSLQAVLSNSFALVFLTAASNGHLELVKELMQSAHFSKMDISVLKWAFKWAAAKDHLEVVRELMRSDRFNEIVGYAFFELVGEKGHLEIVKEPRGSCYLNKMKREDFNFTFDLAAENGHLGWLNELMKLTNFKIIGEINRFAFRFIWAAANGNLELVKELMGSNQIDRCNDALRIRGVSFRSAAANGHLEVLQELVQSDFFKKVSSYTLRSAFRSAAGNGHLKVLQELMRSSCSKEIDVYAFIAAFPLAAANGQLEVVKELMRSDFFKNVASHVLGSAFKCAAANGHLEIAQELIRSDRFNEIDGSTLRFAFFLAIAKGHLKIVQELMSSTRFNEIDGNIVKSAFTSAVEKGHLELLQELMRSDRFSEINRDAFIFVCQSAAKKGQLEVLKELMRSDRFKEINQAKLMEIYSIALAHKDKKFVRSFIALMPIDIEPQPSAT